MTNVLSFIICTAIILDSAHCVNILYIEPVVSPSHHIWNRVLALELVKKGHNVTAIGHDLDTSPTVNYTQFLCEDVYEKLNKIFSPITLVDKSPLTGLKMMYDRTAAACELDLTSAGFRTLYNYPQQFKFDLVIFDATAGQCLYPLIDRFGSPPVVAVTPFLLSSNLANAFGNPLQASYIPFYGGENVEDMTVWKKIINYVLTYGDLWYNEYVVIPTQFAIAQKHFKGHITNFHTVRKNFSILLSNTDPVLDFPMSLPPNIIPVGGLHVKSGSALPEDLAQIVDNAEHGVILFSLGSNIRSDRLGIHQQKAFLKAFSRLPQTILWKFETESLKELPANVVIRKWLPQNDILSHPNTKLFIGHGGALGTQEAMYHGVPIVGIPFYFDQKTNIGKVQQRKLGKYVDITSVTEEKIYTAIIEVLNNDIYKRNAEIVSRRYKDQAQTSLEKGIFWIEYVLRHGGAQHLDLPSRHLSVYKTANLDILLTFLIASILVIVTAKLFNRHVCV